MKVKVTVQLTLDMDTYYNYDNSTEGAKELIEDCLTDGDILETPVIVLEPVNP
jgi:hypothetical protein